MSDTQNTGPVGGERPDREPVQPLSDRYESSELTDEQSAKLRAGRVPGELKLEAIQTIGVIIALVLALVGIIIGMMALSKANSIEESVKSPSAVVQTTKDFEPGDNKIVELPSDDESKAPVTKDSSEG